MVDPKPRERTREAIDDAPEAVPNPVLTAEAPTTEELPPAGGQGDSLAIRVLTWIVAPVVLAGMFIKELIRDVPRLLGALIRFGVRVVLAAASDAALGVRAVAGFVGGVAGLIATRLGAVVRAGARLLGQVVDSVLGPIRSGIAFVASGVATGVQ